MNRLKELGNKLTAILDDVGVYYEYRRAIDEAAAILLAASKVDVAGLMELSRQVAHAYYNWNAGVDDVPDGGFAELEKRKQTLETALRMALAGREWQTLTDDEIYQMYSEPSSDSEMVAFAREVEANLREKNTR